MSINAVVSSAGNYREEEVDTIIVQQSYSTAIPNQTSQTQEQTKTKTKTQTQSSPVQSSPAQEEEEEEPFTSDALTKNLAASLA